MAKQPAYQPSDKRPATTEEQAAKYDKLITKSFVEIDPATGKPKEESKLFFWGIVHSFPAMMGFNDSEFRTMFQIQKYHRNEFVEGTTILPGGKAEKVSKNKPYVKFHTDPARAGEIKELGERMIDAEDFTKQFAIDDSIVGVEDLMQKASELDGE